MLLTDAGNILCTGLGGFLLGHFSRQSWNVLVIWRLFLTERSRRIKRLLIALSLHCVFSLKQALLVVLKEDDFEFRAFLNPQCRLHNLFDRCLGLGQMNKSGL